MGISIVCQQGHRYLLRFPQILRIKAFNTVVFGSISPYPMGNGGDTMFDIGWGAKCHQVWFFDFLTYQFSDIRH